MQLKWGARPPRAQPTTPPSSASVGVGAHQAEGSLHESSARGRAEQQPRRLRSPKFQLHSYGEGRRRETIVRHLAALSPGVSVVGLPPVPPQSLVSTAALVVQNLTVNLNFLQRRHDERLAVLASEKRVGS